MMFPSLVFLLLYTTQDPFTGYAYQESNRATHITAIALRVGGKKLKGNKTNTTPPKPDRSSYYYERSLKFKQIRAVFDVDHPIDRPWKTKKGHEAAEKFGKLIAGDSLVRDFLESFKNEVSKKGEEALRDALSCLAVAVSVVLKQALLDEYDLKYKPPAPCRNNDSKKLVAELLFHSGNKCKGPNGFLTGRSYKCLDRWFTGGISVCILRQRNHERITFYSCQKSLFSNRQSRYLTLLSTFYGETKTDRD